MNDVHTEPVPPGESPANELHGEEAYAKLETALRNAMPDFHLRAKLKGVRFEKLPRGVLVDLRFDRRLTSPEIPEKLRFIVSRARAESIRLQLNRVLDA